MTETPHLDRVVALAYGDDWSPERLRAAVRGSEPEPSPEVARSILAGGRFPPGHRPGENMSQYADRVRPMHEPGGRTRDYERVERGRVEHVSGHIEQHPAGHVPWMGEYLPHEDAVQRMTDDAMASRKGKLMGGHRRVFEMEARGALAHPHLMTRFLSAYELGEHSRGR